MIDRKAMISHKKWQESARRQILYSKNRSTTSGRPEKLKKKLHLTSRQPILQIIIAPEDYLPYSPAMIKVKWQYLKEASLLCLYVKPIKIGAKVVRHSRYVTFQIGRGSVANA